MGASFSKVKNDSALSGRQSVKKKKAKTKEKKDTGNAADAKKKGGKKKKAKTPEVKADRLSLDIGGPKNMVTALYSYTPQEDNDLQFEVGDLMEIVSKSDPEWWSARLIKTNEVGFIPCNYVAEVESIETNDWYFADVTRKETESFLLEPENGVGVFLIRPSEREPKTFTLSVKDRAKEKSGGYSIKHYRIRPMDGGEGYYITPTHKHKTLGELIKYYTNGSNGLCCALKTACPRPQPALKDLSSETKKKWEISRNDLTIIMKLGSGQFGEVYKARHISGHEVAVKTLKPGTMTISQFLAEADVMKKCDHPNLVTLFAICSNEEPIYIVTELMDGGSLLEYLKGDLSRGLGKNDFVDFAAQCAAGMSYLERHKIVHRDLAARNVLVTLTKMAKVADFGLARAVKEDAYIVAHGAKFPIKWTAIEAACYGKFTVKSDVWSYGILLVEIFTKGQTPYPGMGNSDVLQKLQNGYRMPQYEDVPDAVYATMEKCWDKEPERRPTFESIQDFFENYTETDYLDDILFRT